MICSNISTSDLNKLSKIVYDTICIIMLHFYYNKFNELIRAIHFSLMGVTLILKYAIFPLMVP